MEKLQEEYDAWLKANVPAHWLKDGVADLSAENLMACGRFVACAGHENNPAYDWSPNREQYAWLADFCERWKKEEQA